MANKHSDDQEADRRRDELLRRLLHMPPESREDVLARKRATRTSGKRATAKKRGPSASKS